MSERDDAIAELIVAVFRLNGRLLDAGDRLVSELGLTSAWWQVLGALALSPVPLPVAHIARNMGLARQSVQRIADLLAEKALVRFEANPHHQRAKLVVLTALGAAAVKAAEERQRPWARDMAAGLHTARIAAALEVLTRMDLHLANTKGATDDEPDQVRRSFDA
jgi:DNA-binding MarR family transcriptional regulator